MSTISIVLKTIIRESFTKRFTEMFYKKVLFFPKRIRNYPNNKTAMFFTTTDPVIQEIRNMV